MKTFTLFISSLLIATLTNAQCPGIEKKDGNFMRSIDILNEVFVASQDTIYGVGANGRMLKTANAGKYWTRISIDTANLKQLTSLHFINGQIGWVVGKSGTIFRTNNGGTTWNKQYQKTPLSFSGTFFTNDQNGWAIGEQGTILHTNDGGQNWQEQTIQDSVALSDLHFTDQNNGWIVGNKGRIFHTNDGGQQWMLQDSSVNTSLNGVDFINGDTGWVAGNDGTLLYTTNGGQNWQTRAVDTSIHFYDADFVNTQKGWLTGTNGKVFATSDGGQNWHRQTLRTNKALYSVDFISASTGWVAGAGGIVLKTTNGGEKWPIQNCSSIGQSGFPIGTLDFNNIQFIDSQTGYASSGLGIFLRTKNGGKDWQFQTCGIGMRIITDIHFQNAREGWAVGGDPFGMFVGNYKGRIMHTNDSGVTWQIQDSGSYRLLNELHFTDENNGWAVGRHGTVVRTTDGGATWDTLKTGAPAFLRSIHFVNENIGWVAGKEGTVLKTTDGGDTWDEQNTPVSSFIKAMDFVSPDTGWMMGEELIYTTDGGATWKNGLSGKNIRSLQFVNKNRGLAVGGYRTLLQTLNGGKSWFQLDHSIDNYFYDVEFINNKEAWAVGENGAMLKIDPNFPTASFDYETDDLTVYFNNTSLKDNETLWSIGDTFIYQSEKPVYTFDETGIYEACLRVENSCGYDTTCQTIKVNTISIRNNAKTALEIYPNPAQDRLTIEKEKPKDKLSLKLINAQGQSVLKTSFTESQKSLDVSHLSQGIYFLKINGPDPKNTVVEKMVVE